MVLSKTQIDKAGIILSNEIWKSEKEYEERTEVLNLYRQSHLLPITEVTLKLQEWLEKAFSHRYYIAQRLKRKPQILRKLRRLSVRLSQLQDIGGCRIIVENNNVTDELVRFIHKKLVRNKFFVIKKETDYREAGRDTTGYRAYHIIIERNGYKLEIQIRTRLQHYWAESIERASVIYREHLKEMEGDPAVLKYFKLTSDLFHKIERGYKPSLEERNKIDTLHIQAKKIMTKNHFDQVLNAKVEDGFIRAMIARESNLRYKLNNWMLIFNWKKGKFENWILVSRDCNKATEQYADYEKQFTSENGYEVVMIGSSDVSVIQHTHSHYFGIDNYDKILETVDESLSSFHRQNYLEVGERMILLELYKRGYWGIKKVMSINTLRNHYCKEIPELKQSLAHLAKEGYVIYHTRKGTISLNLKKKAEIELFMT